MRIAIGTFICLLLLMINFNPLLDDGSVKEITISDFTQESFAQTSCSGRTCLTGLELTDPMQGTQKYICDAYLGSCECELKWVNYQPGYGTGICKISDPGEG